VPEREFTLRVVSPAVEDDDVLMPMARPKAETEDSAPHPSLTDNEFIAVLFRYMGKMDVSVAQKTEVRRQSVSAILRDGPAAGKDP
jgi:hypothetical protein